MNRAGSDHSRKDQAGKRPEMAGKPWKVQEKWKSSCKVNLLFIPSRFLKEKERNKCQFYEDSSGPQPPISLTNSLFTFSHPQRPSRPLAARCCLLQQSAGNCSPSQKTALAATRRNFYHRAPDQCSTTTCSKTNERLMFYLGFQATPGLTQSSTFCTCATSLGVLQTDCKVGKGIKL